MADKYLIKQIPEDFVVIEQASLDLNEKGSYIIFKLWKMENEEYNRERKNKQNNVEFTKFER